MLTFESLLDRDKMAIKVDSFAQIVRNQYREYLENFELFFDVRFENVIQLNRLYIKKEYRKQGIGSQIMGDVCRFADQNGFIIALETAQKDRNTGTTSEGRLQRFYRRFGFVRNIGRNKKYQLSMYSKMYRMPH